MKTTIDTPRSVNPVSIFHRTRNFQKRSLYDGTDSLGISLDTPDETLAVNEYLGGELAFCGTGADNATIEFAVFLVRQMGNRTEERKFNGKPIGCYEHIALLTSGTATLSALTGVEGSVVSENERFADTITFTESAYAGYIEALRGRSIATYSPGSDAGIATVGFPDLNGAIGIVIERTGGSADEASALINLLT